MNNTSDDYYSHTSNPSHPDYDSSHDEWVAQIEDDIVSIWKHCFETWILSTDNPEREFALFREGCCVYNQLPKSVTDALDHVHCYGAEDHPYRFIQACIRDYELLTDGMTAILDKYASEAAQEIVVLSKKQGKDCDLEDVVKWHTRQGNIEIDIKLEPGESVEVIGGKIISAQEDL